MSAALLLLCAAVSAPPARAVDFDTEVLPVLTKAGCNAGACHGAAFGRGEFRLSLFGADPAADYLAIVQDLEGRRVNLAKPAESLLIQKAAGMIDHGGDVALEGDGAGAMRLLEWIAAGAPRMTSRRLSSFHVEPIEQAVNSLDAQVALRAEAVFSDGTREDVTAWTVFTSNDPGAVEISETGDAAIVHRRGQHVVLARFLDRIVPIQLVLPFRDDVPASRNDPHENWIDDEIASTLAKLGIAASPPVDDASFLRRVTLDLTGRLPDAATVREFLTDPSDGKRAAATERLLASEEFVEYWTFRLTQWLRARSLRNEPAAYAAYREWISAQVRADASWKDTAQQLVLATGDSHHVGQANFARSVSDARGEAELVSQAFLGVRLQCANCHRHPLDRWSQDDYHGLAAVFARLHRGRDVRMLPRGAVTNPRTGDPAAARIPGYRDIDPGADPRAAFAEWLTAPENPYFARAIVNRLWQALFGRGLVEPVDDLRATNPATHPELLDRLADDFVAQGYRIRQTLRQIALSEAYQRGSATIENAVDDRFYSHAIARPLEPEVLVDAIADVTRVANQYGDLPFGVRAIAVPPDVQASFLAILGNCPSTEACASDSSAPALAARLHLLNGDLINAKLSDESGRLKQFCSADTTNEAVVEGFYLSALGRYPTSGERSYWSSELPRDHAPDRAAALQDFVWSLLNSREFASNH